MNDISTYIPDIPRKWLKRLAQIGLTSKAVLYCLLGALAFLAALELGKSREEIGKKSVFLFIEDLLMGRVILVIVAFGLGCYSLWRILQAAKDLENKGTDLKGLGVRLQYGFSGAFYGMLAYLALKLAFIEVEDDESIRQGAVQMMLQEPLSQLLLMTVSVGIAIAGCYKVYQGLSGSYKTKIEKAGWKDDIEISLIRAGTIGYIARGIVWIAIAYLILQATLFTRSMKAFDGIDVYSFLEHIPYGSLVLVCVSLGLVCYGLFIFMEAKFKSTRT